MRQHIKAWVAALTACVALAGCVGQPIVGFTPTPSQTLDPATMSSTDLYNYAVTRYKVLHGMIIDMELQGGAAMLPAQFRDYLMEPAWSSVNDVYNHWFVTGVHYDGVPTFKLMAVGPWRADDDPPGTLTAVETCELAEGAAEVDGNGTVIADASPFIMHRRMFFNRDPTDGQLKVFKFWGEGVATCPIAS